jgi:hypothetical protein
VELVDPVFPFRGGNEVGFPCAPGNAVAEDDSDVFVTAARPPTSPSDDPNVNPVIETSGAATAQFAQRARDRDPRARAENQSDKAAEESGKDNGKGKKGSVRTDSALADGETSAQSNDDKDTRHNADKKKQRAKDDSKHKSNKGKAKEKAKDRDKKSKHKKSNHERTRHKRH